MKSYMRVVSRVVLLLALCFGLVCEEARARVVLWAGWNWLVKNGTDLGPGPNDWSDSTNNVWVDASGYLHLKITEVGGNWYCPELISEQSFGYGEYRFKLATEFDKLDTNVVGGLFTYLDDNNELDIEFVQAWTGTNNANFATQPARAGNVHEFHAAFTEGSYSTHRFIWETNSIFYQSYFGHADPPPGEALKIAEWTYTSNSIPVASTEKLHLNLWLFQGRVPTDTQQLELVVHEFVFVPSTNSLPPMAGLGVFEDEFNDSSLSNIWRSFNDPEFVVETNGVLRINPYGTDVEQFGVVTTNAIQWNAASGVCFQAKLDWIDVTQTGTTEGVHVKALMAAVSEPQSVWFATNAAVLLAGYDSTANVLRLSFATKTGQPSSMGTERYSGVVTNASAYLGNGGVVLSFTLDGDEYRVQAWNSENLPVTLNGSPSGDVGLHYLGGTLTNAYWVMGGQDWYDSTAYIYYDWTHVFLTNAMATNTPGPSPVTNVVSIGGGTSTRRNPLNAYYEQERLQTLYLSREIRWTGTLTELSIDVARFPTIPLSNYTIRLQHVTQTSMSKGWISNGWTTVYQGTLIITNNGWHTFVLTNFFYYNGSNSLLVDFSKSNEGWVDAGFVRFTQTNVNRSYEQFIDGSSDPLTWTGQLPLRNGITPPGINKYMPNIRMMFSDDGDEDGMPDAWEVGYCGALTNMTASSDSDGDGFMDVHEYRAGTDPTNRNSLLRFVATNDWGGGGIVIRWLSAEGKSYSIDRATNLLSPVAFSSLGFCTSTPPINVYTDSTVSSTGPFLYRIRLAP